MQERSFRTADDAVSPVIGVILMVAITVLLAATAAVFFIGLGQEQPENVPTTAFTFDYDAGSGDTLTIKHQGGDMVSSDEVYVVIDDASVSSGTVEDRYAFHELSAVPSGSRVSSGQRATLSDSELGVTGLDLSSAEVTVVWESADSGRSTELGSWTGPDN